MEPQDPGLPQGEQRQGQPPHDAAKPPNPQPPPAAAEQNSSKRKLDVTGFQDSVYSKLRVVVRDLRPYFVQVIHAQNFWDCKAVNDIQKHMKIILELSKQLRAASNVEEKRDSQVGNPAERNNLETAVKNTSQASSTPIDPGLLPKTTESEMPSKPVDHMSKVPESILLGAKEIEKELMGTKGSYIVGGSPLGWNFLIYPSTEPVYYGVTKETWLSKQQPKSKSEDP